MACWFLYKGLLSTYLTKIHFTGEVSIYYEYKAYEDEMAVPSLNRNVTFKRQMSDV